jgi:hypothetical protein
MGSSSEPPRRAKMWLLLIGLAKKKTSGASRWPESKGRFCNFFPASGWPIYNSAVLSLARKAKIKMQLSSETFFFSLFLISFLLLSK